MLVSGRNIESLDCLLNIFDPSALLLLKHAPLFIVLLLALLSVSIQIVLVLLLDFELSQLKLPLLVLSRKGNFLLLAAELGFKLFRKSSFVFLKLNTPLLLQPIFFLAD